MTEQAFTISPSQALKLVALCDALKNGDVDIVADEEEVRIGAMESLKDVGEELALQMIGY